MNLHSVRNVESFIIWHLNLEPIEYCWKASIAVLEWTGHVQCAVFPLREATFAIEHDVLPTVHAVSACL